MSNFETLTSEALVTVAGGNTSSDTQLTTMLQSISSSIKEVASAKNQGTDPTQMMMMMMMMGGMGGGGSQQVVAAPPPAPAAPTIVKVRV